LINKNNQRQILVLL